MTSFSFTSCSE